MSSWGHRQQTKYILTAVIIVAVLLIVAVYFGFFNNKPTCFDGKLNGDETGVDCGGSCLKICEADQLNPIVLYTRIFQVNNQPSDGIYSLLAVIEDPNVSLYAQNVPYIFKIYDKDNVVIGERKGEVFIPPNKIFPIFEGTFKTGTRVPARMTFQFSDSPVWRKAVLSEPALNVLNENVTVASSSARLEALLENPYPYDLSNIEVVALLYDENDNVFAASKTVVDSLPRRVKAPLIFTWPVPFTASTSKIDIIPNTPYEDFIPGKAK